MAFEIDITDLIARWDGAWFVDGRPISNCEMLALSEYKREQEMARVEARQCDDCEGPWEDGVCRCGCGKCIFVRDAEQLIWRYEHDGQERTNNH